MTTLTQIECDKHTPNKSAISTIWHDAYSADAYTFCENCEQNITRFAWYDDDRGVIWTNWSLGK